VAHYFSECYFLWNGVATVIFHTLQDERSLIRGEELILLGEVGEQEEGADTQK
jgi:hypothetical protein